MYNPHQHHPEWSSHSQWSGHHYPQGPPPPPHHHQTPPTHIYHHSHQQPQLPPRTRTLHAPTRVHPHQIASHPPLPPSPAYYASTPRSMGSARTPYNVASMPQPVLISPPQQQHQQHQQHHHHQQQSSPNPQGHASASVGSPASAASPHDDGNNNSNNTVTTKPPRPYTEYTMFYQLEREFILHRVLANTGDEEQDSDTTASRVALFKNDPLMPARYRDLPLRADWYISGKSKKPTKRKHRKTHGKIGFLELTRMIASRWSSVDDETRKYCKMMAAMELVKYKEDMEAYNQYKERLSAIGEIPEDMKEREDKKKKAASRKEAKLLKEEEASATSGGGQKKTAKPKGKCSVVKADTVISISKASPTVNSKVSKKSKLEPLAHDASEKSEVLGSKLDNDMEQFICSLVGNGHEQAAIDSKPAALPETVNADTDDHELWAKFEPPKKRKAESPRRNPHSIVVTPDRRRKKTVVVSQEDNRHSDTPPETPQVGGRESPELDPIMAFEGIDENEIAREFYVDHQMNINTTRDEPEELFEPIDFWDVLVEPTDA